MLYQSHYLRQSIVVCRITSVKGKRRLKISHISTIFMSAVLGRLSTTDISILVSTNITVRFTDKADSKKKVVGDVTDDVEENCWCIYHCNHAQKTSPK